MGLGGYGFSVQVGSYQDNSYSSNSTGTSQSGQVPNLKFASPTGAFVANESVATILSGSGSIQMAEATLHVQFNSTDIGNTQLQNTSFRVFDGTSINNNPSGVTIQAFELRSNPSGNSIPAGFNVNGDTSWSEIFGSGSVLDIEDQLWPSGIHNFYIGVSGKPNSIGSKLYAYFFETEYS
jgi:hypothetical protein